MREDLKEKFIEHMLANEKDIESIYLEIVLLWHTKKQPIDAEKLEILKQLYPEILV